MVWSRLLHFRRPPLEGNWLRIPFQANDTLRLGFRGFRVRVRVRIRLRARVRVRVWVRIGVRVRVRVVVRLRGLG